MEVFENRTRYQIWVDALQFTSDTDTTILQGRIHGKKYDFFLRKIVIFSHEIPQKCSWLAPLGAIILSAPPNLKSWIHPCIITFLTNRAEIRQQS